MTQLNWNIFQTFLSNIQLQIFIQMDELCKKLYLSNIKNSTSSFAYNRAAIYDLEMNGPLPIIDSSSTIEDLARAILIMKERNYNLKELIKK